MSLTGDKFADYQLLTRFSLMELEDFFSANSRYNTAEFLKYYLDQNFPGSTLTSPGIMRLFENYPNLSKIYKLTLKNYKNIADKWNTLTDILLYTSSEQFANGVYFENITAYSNWNLLSLLEPFDKVIEIKKDHTIQAYFNQADFNERTFEFSILSHTEDFEESDYIVKDMIIDLNKTKSLMLLLLDGNGEWDFA